MDCARNPPQGVRGAPMSSTSTSVSASVSAAVSASASASASAWAPAPAAESISALTDFARGSGSTRPSDALYRGVNDTDGIRTVEWGSSRRTGAVIPRITGLRMARSTQHGHRTRSRSDAVG